MQNLSIPKIIKYTCPDGSEINIHIKQSNRSKRVTLKLIQGEFVAVVPSSITEFDLRRTIKSCSDWIDEHHFIAIQQLREREIPSEIAIPLEGIVYKISTSTDLKQAYQDIRTAPLGFLVQNDAQRIALVQKDNTICLYGDVNNIHLVAQALQDWGKRKGEELLPEFCRTLAKNGNFIIGRITVRDQRTRWGSCSRKGDGVCNISLNWRAVLLPEPLVRQLCHHEICHTMHMDHSPAFHALMQSLDVDSEALECGLNDASKNMPWWAHYSAI
ncbi:MAG: DUF45 domain-containing protein [Desulfovibrionaceae bacterium]|nr:DUF45 domain-containing protein [Desulfovibrionaceae bacterium]